MRSQLADETSSPRQCRRFRNQVQMTYRGERHRPSRRKVVNVNRRAGGKPRNISKDAIRRLAQQSTKASAKLEGRALPAGYVRSSQAAKFLAERTTRA